MIELNMQRTEVGATAISEAIAELSATIKADPLYGTLWAAHQALQVDEEAQQLLEDVQLRQRRLQFSAAGADEAEFQALLERFYRLPVVAAYHEAEDALVDLLKEIDGVISTTMGIDFAANAKRSCCGG